MSEALAYYDAKGLSGPFYDVVAHFDPTLSDDLAFYEALVPEGAWVLELGCGTGRIGLPLAQKNRAVVGLDLAPAMLAQAQAKRKALPVEVRERTAFVQADMTRFSLNHHFDAVISPFFSFSHLPTRAPRKATFEAIARHLNPGGVCAIHTVRAETVATLKPSDPDQAVLDVEYEPKGGRLRLYVPVQTYDPVTRRFDQVLDYVVLSPEGTELRRSRESLTYYVSNLDSDARGSGLVLTDKISPFNQVGEMWVFRKA